MESKEKNTKEKILEEALKLFAQSGYMSSKWPFLSKDPSGKISR